jgi:hypothetical protein
MYLSDIFIVREVSTRNVYSDVLKSTSENEKHH